MNEVLKSVVAQYNAIELIVKREQVSAEVRNRLQARAKDFFILLDDVSIVSNIPCIINPLFLITILLSVRSISDRRAP